MFTHAKFHYKNNLDENISPCVQGKKSAPGHMRPG